MENVCQEQLRIEDEEDHQPEGIQQAELPSNQEKQLSLAAENKKVELTSPPKCKERRADYWPERTLPGQRNKFKLCHPYIGGNHTPHQSVGSKLHLTHNDHYIFSCLIVCSNLLPLEFYLKKLFSKGGRPNCVTVISVDQVRTMLV